MKNLKKVLVVVLAFAMMLSMTACTKALSGDDFENIMDDLDYNVNEYDDTDKGIKEQWVAYDDDYEYYVTYMRYKDAEDAKDDFNDAYDDLKDAKDDEEFEGKLSKSIFGAKKITVNGEFDDSDDWADGEMYMVIILADDTIITLIASDNGKSDVKEIDNIVKELGY